MNTPIEDLMRDTSEKPWMYFGCIGPQAGHYLYDQSLRTPNLHYSKRQLFTNLDGKMCHEGRTPYRPKLTRLPKTGYSSFAFWDYIGDSRGGSNSIFFAPDLNLDLETLWVDIQTRFPARLIKRWEGKICLS